jgi:triacylglycerol lipase
MNLIFASGFLFPQRLFGIDYFNGLANHLGAGPHVTLFPPVAPLASSQARALKLADEIQRGFPQGPVHIIAQSMGGLDSRHLIAANHHGLSDPGRNISVTTLSTPHRGSPVADLLAGPRPAGQFGFTYDAIRQAIGVLGIDIGALGDLTAHSAAQLPDVAATHPHIRYRSYFAAGRQAGPATSLALLPTHEFVLARTGQANDGLVALDSARYGEFQDQFWLCDHADMVGHNLNFVDPLFQFDQLAEFDNVIGRL